MALLPHWPPPPPEPRIGEKDVHVWRASLDCERAVLEHLQTSLTEDERARASRFVFPRDRDRFIAGRGILRSILGQYSRQPAAAVEFTYEPKGKPRLSSHDSNPAVRFSVSHSEGLAVYAFSCGREIGVDVEAIRSNLSNEGIAEQFFSSTELAEFRSLPREQSAEGFFLCWTRKEAYVKALGGGLTIPLDSFDVSLTPGMPETLSSADCGQWTLRSFRPSDGYAGAVVAEGKDWSLHFWDWTSLSIASRDARNTQHGHPR
jgi:4'-phosphopantetheinyl transferase